MLAELRVADWGVVARTIHVLAIVVWIGGVWFVTVVLLPAIKDKQPADWIQAFNTIERGFAPQARIAVLLTLLSGLYMLYDYNLWGRFVQGAYWWMDLMAAVWVLFAVPLFIIEPLFLRRTRHRSSVQTPEARLSRILWLHRVVLALALLAIFAAVGGSHGLF